MGILLLMSFFFVSDKRSFGAVLMILNFSFSLSVSFLDCSNCFKIFSATEQNVTTLRLPLIQVIMISSPKWLSNFCLVCFSVYVGVSVSRWSSIFLQRSVRVICSSSNSLR